MIVTRSLHHPEPLNGVRGFDWCFASCRSSGWQWRLGKGLCFEKGTGGHCRCRKIGCCHGRAHPPTTAQFLLNYTYGFSWSYNMPTPLISEIQAQVDHTILEVICRNGTVEAHWRACGLDPTSTQICWHEDSGAPLSGGFRITPNEVSTISAFYAATCALIVWLGCHGGALPAQQFADSWAPGQDLTSPEAWHAPLLQALSKSHALIVCCSSCWG